MKPNTISMTVVPNEDLPYVNLNSPNIQAKRAEMDRILSLPKVREQLKKLTKQPTA